jgi:hypothetical protein
MIPQGNSMANYKQNRSKNSIIIIVGCDVLNHRAKKRVVNPNCYKLRHSDAVTLAEDRGELKW